MKPYKSISSSHTLAMEGSSSAQSPLIRFNPFLLSSLGSSSSPPIQNASTVTPQEGELPGKDNVAMEGWSLLDFTKLQLGCPGSSSSSSPTQNANGATNQQRDLLGELPGKDTVAMEGWSLLDFTKLQLGCPGSSFSSSPTQNANGATNQQHDLLGKGLKRKRSPGSVVPNDNGRPVPRNNEEENHYAGISTELVLYEDKCKIKKKLKKSDLSDRLSRLMLSRDSVEAHVLPLMDEEMKEQVKSKNGMKVVVRNADTLEEHKLVFRRWETSGSYVLNCGWTKLFVKGRGLEEKDEIGMFWDTDDRKFHFTVHRKILDFFELPWVKKYFSVAIIPPKP
ncbi:hypothetical protein EUGRSUZ_E01938 [Eucalyptus grandis]|uniref:TF-B3 domain-containing protein n=2 Tax=Eucalyptus grandis TaxID=71139 RepID=A0A059C5N1_EUCGR|nr:hypothetical protein EUGRSUZ_E01938 [Eucalyptus grandis]